MESKQYGNNNDKNTSFLSLDLSDCLNHIDDMICTKSEPLSFGNSPEQPHTSNTFSTKKESDLKEEIFSNQSEHFTLNDFDEKADLSLLSDEYKITSSDYEYDIVNIDLLTSEPRIKDLLEVNSPGSFSSSHHSILDERSVDSRPSTTNTFYTNFSLHEFCAICNDSATGKHYGVSACEGCKGFFKRTIRKKLQFVCRESNNCPVTEKLRNRCQACRFKKCIEKGMKIEAVQRERPSKRKLSFSSSSISSSGSVITADGIYRNEVSSSSLVTDPSWQGDVEEAEEIAETRLLCATINKQLFQLVMWAKAVPGFSQLSRADQMVLLNRSWVEVLLASMAFRSTAGGKEGDDGSLRVDESYHLSQSLAASLGLTHLAVRILRELVASLRAIGADQMEVACLKIVILFDPTIPGLRDARLVRKFRLSIFGILQRHSIERRPTEPSRAHKLLLTLAAVRGLAGAFVGQVGRVLEDAGDAPFPLLHEMMCQTHYPFCPR